MAVSMESDTADLFVLKMTIRSPVSSNSRALLQRMLSGTNIQHRFSTTDPLVDLQQVFYGPVFQNQSNNNLKMKTYYY